MSKSGQRSMVASRATEKRSGREGVPHSPVVRDFRPCDYRRLQDRLGANGMRRRLRMQTERRAETTHQGRGLMWVERVIPVDRMITWVLEMLRLYERGNRNFRDIRLTENAVELPSLPHHFEGFRILHLSDLHLDLDTRITPAIIETVSDLAYDVAVITGDFRNSTTDFDEVSMTETRKLVQAMRGPIYGILGNHDCIEFVPALEDAGVQILLNETTAIEREQEALYLSGVDDPCFYQTHDLVAPRRCIPAGACSILLAHGPVVYARAAALGYDLMLCGHTHGGQICLPGGYALHHPGRCPRRMVSGTWRHRGMQGFTSRGTGSCGVAARFNCLPEVALHTLHTGKERCYS